MRALRIAFTGLLAILLMAGTTWAQFGLCGAPELVQIPRAQRPLLPQYTYGNQYGYESGRNVTVEHHYHPVQIGYQQPAACPPYPQSDANQQAAAYRQQAVYSQIAGQRPPATYVWPNAAYGAPSKPVRPTPMPNGAQKAVPGNSIREMLGENQPLTPGPMAHAADYGPCSASCCPPNDSCLECGSCMQECCDCRCPWYASLLELNMGRNQANGIWTTYESADLTNQMLKSNFDLRWASGGEIRFGRRFCCDAWAMEFVYWTLDPFNGTVSASVPGGTVSTTLEVTEVEFVGNGVTTNADAIFRNSAEQRLCRTDEVHNFELNLLRGGFCGCDTWPWGTQWLMGFRYLRFRDRLIYSAVMQNNTWGSDGGIHEGYINDHVRNNIFAFQFGFDTKAPKWHGLQAFLSPRIALGCNHIENEYQIYRGDGVAGRPTAASGMPGTFPVTSVKDAFSLITQIDIGLDWQITERWNARIGYRLTMATGMGLADNQIPFYIVDIPEVEDIDHNAELILHGGFLGITYNF